MFGKGTAQRRIKEGGGGGAPPPPPPPPYFKTKLRPEGPKKFFGDWALPYLRVWMIETPSYLKVWIRHCSMLVESNPSPSCLCHHNLLSFIMEARNESISI